MSLKHILLGMLHEPASGYDIKKCLNNSLQHFWAANLSQIYPQLSSMETDGLLRSRLSESDRGPQRRVYRRTAKGTRELKRWLEEGPHMSDERRHFVAQVFFLGALEDPAKAAAFLESLRAKMLDKLEALQVAEEAWRRRDARYPDHLPDDGFYPHLTLKLGQRVFSTYVDWCDECLVRIEARRGAKPGRQGV